MKITQTLLTLFSKMEKKEGKEFERYLAYKNRKKLHDLYLCFVQKQNIEEVDYSIKRKKLERNLRYNLNELLELVKKFWIDREETNSNSKELEIFNTIRFTSNLYSRGMFEFAIEQIKLAEQLANENYLYQLAYHARRKLAVLSWRQYPKESEIFFEELRVKHDEYLESMTLNSKVVYLTERSMFLLYKGIWSLNDEQMTFLNGVENESLKLLEMKGLTNNFRVGLLQQLGYVSFLIKMDGEAACKYAREIVNTLNNSTVSYSIKDFNKIVSYEFLLKLLNLAGKKEEFATRYMEFTDLIDKQEKLNPTLGYLYAFTILYHLKMNITEEESFNENVGKVHFFLKEFGMKMSPEFIGGIQQSLFEVYYYRGDFENAAVCLDKLKEVNNTKMPNLKFLEFTAEVLLAYENDENEYIINRCLAFRRVAPKYLAFNPAGNLFISCLLKLCKTNNTAERKDILKDYKLKIEPLLENIRYRYMLLIYHIVPWMESKINDYPTVFDYLKACEKVETPEFKVQR